MRWLTIKYTLLLSAFFTASVQSQRNKYAGYQVIRVPTRPDTDDMDRIQKIIDDLKLKTWKRPKVPGADVDIMVSPTKLGDFQNLTAGLKLEVMHGDLGASIDLEGTLFDYLGGYFRKDNDDWFKAYHGYDAHLRWLNDLHAAHPANSEIVVAGNSLENRPITGIRFWGNGGKDKKPAAIFHGTVHAREWISTMVAEYIALQLLAGYASDPSIKAIVDRYDFYFFPVANPDGFVYTQTIDRMWRKNRQINANSTCIGTDINRNWPYQWEGDGSSPDPCNDAYRGDAPGSAPETVVHARFLQNLANQNGIKIYIDFHSYSQYFMWPYGYDCWVLAPNDAQLQSLAKSFATAVEAVNGTHYYTGTICSTVYQANGNSVDWVTAEVHAETAFAAELRDKGQYGFVLPPDQIIPSGNETWAGFKALMTELG